MIRTLTNKQTTTNKDNHIGKFIPKSISGVIWNLSGRCSSAIFSLLAVPFLVKSLGLEAWGLIGFYNSIAALFPILEFGLSATLNRELSRDAVRLKHERIVHTILPTFERLNIAIALLVFIISSIVLIYTSFNWIQLTNVHNLDLVTISTLFAAVFATRWPVSIYNATLFSQLHFKAVNITLIIASFARTFGALACITYISNTVVIYTSSLLVFSLCETLLLRYLAWRSVASLIDKRPKWDLNVLRNTIIFSVSFAMVGFLGMVYSAMDKWVLARVVTADQLGIYMIAYTPAGIMTMAGAAVGKTLLPNFSRQFEAKDTISQQRYLLIAIGFMLAFILPALLLFILFGPQILTFWLRDHQLATSVFPISIILMIALSINAIANPFYSLLISKGQTVNLLISNFAILIISVISIVYLSLTYGIIGAAFAVVTQNIFILVFLSFYSKSIIANILIRFFRCS